MRLKKVLAALTSVSLLAGSVPTLAAYSDGTLDEDLYSNEYSAVSDTEFYDEEADIELYSTTDTRKYLWQNDFSLNFQCFDGTTLEIDQDPKNSENKVLKVKQSALVGHNTKYYTFGPVSGPYASSPTWASKNVDASKNVVAEVDICLPASLAEEFGADGTMAISLPVTNDGWTYATEGKIKVTVVDGKFQISSAKTENKITVEPGTWFNVRYVFTLGDNNSTNKALPLEIYVDGNHYVTDQVGDYSYSYYQFSSSQAMKGLTFASTKNIENGYYIDNASIFQFIDQELTLSVSDGDTDVDGGAEFTAECAAKISAADFKGKITAKEGENTITATVVQKDDYTIGFSFAGLKDETEYTLKIDTVTSGEASILKKELKFTTKAASNVFARCDLAENSEVEPGELSFNLLFSKAVSTETLKEHMTAKDEDGNDISFTLTPVDETTVAVTFAKLEELTSFTVKIDDSFVSEGNLPISEAFELNFRTKEESKAPITDPYEPATNSDSVILSNDDFINGQWFVNNKSRGSVSVETDGEESYVKLHVDGLEGDNNTAVTFYPNSDSKDTERESKTAKYLLDNMLVYEYEIKYPDVSKLASATVTYAMYPNDESLAEDKITGTWTPTLKNEFTTAKGLRTYKQKNVVTLKPTAEIADEWIKMKTVIDTKTGDVWVYMPDGTVDKTTVSMHEVPGWGVEGGDPNMDWGKYMVTKQIYIPVKANENESADVYIKNFSAKRITNTLSVENANFAYGEHYIDTSNIQLKFNDELAEGDLDGCVSVEDKDGNKVDCTVTVTGEGKDFTVSLEGLAPYTEYHLVVDGAVSKSVRKMRERFERMFITKKTEGAFIDTSDDNATLNTYGKKLSKADKLDYTVVMKSETGTAGTVLGAVAIYGENDELLAIKYQDLTLGNNTFEFTNVPNGAVSVKIFAWNTENGQVGGLIHEPDSLQEVKNSEYELEYVTSLPDFKVAIADGTKSIIGVSGNATDASGVYTIAVLEGKDTPISDMETKTVLLMYANVKDSKFAQTGVLDKASGDYTVWVIGDSGSYSKNFEFIRLDDVVNNYIKPIADGTTKQNEIYSEMVKFNAGIGIDLSTNFVSDRDKKLFEKRMYEKRTLLVGPTNAEYATQLQANIDYAKDEIKYLNELAAITYYGVVKTKLEEGVKFTGIDFTAFNKLTDVQKSAVCVAFIGKTFADGDEVKDFFDKNVKAPNIPDEGSSPSPDRNPSGGLGIGSKPPAIGVGGVTDQKEVTADDVFSDMGNYGWAKSSVLYLAKRGIVNGTEKGKFNPSGLITREEFVKMAVLAMDIHNEKAVSDFEDVIPGAWFGSYVASAKQKNLVNGINEKNFGVGMYITREDVATIIYRMFEQKGIKLTNQKADFADMQNLSDYAYAPVAALAGEGIIKGMGDNMFMPKNNTTRAEAAVLIDAFMKGVN